MIDAANGNGSTVHSTAWLGENDIGVDQRKEGGTLKLYAVLYSLVPNNDDSVYSHARTDGGSAFSSAGAFSVASIPADVCLMSSSVDFRAMLLSPTLSLCSRDNSFYDYRCPWWLCDVDVCKYVKFAGVQQ